MSGGLSIPYATTATNNRTGITIGGTRYFMVFPLLRMADPQRPQPVTTQAILPHRRGGPTVPASDHKMLVSTAIPRARQASSITVRKYFLSFALT